MPNSVIDIQTPDGVADAYLTSPDNAPHPGVLLLMDAFGLRPRLEEMADRVAARGYTVLVPNLFYRAGRSPLFEMPDLSGESARMEFFKTLRPMMDSLTPERIVADGGAYLDKLQQVAPGPVAISGYCLGTRIGLRIAAAYPDRVAALGGFHGGGLVTDADDSPHLLAPDVRAELYFGHADHDQSNSPDQIAALDEALAAAGVTSRSEVYADAAHGYTMSDTPAFDATACERHFEALFDLLERTIGSHH